MYFCCSVRSCLDNRARQSSFQMTRGMFSINVDFITLKDIRVERGLAPESEAESHISNIRCMEGSIRQLLHMPRNILPSRVVSILKSLWNIFIIIWELGEEPLEDSIFSQQSLLASFTWFSVYFIKHILSGNWGVHVQYHR